MTVEEMFKQVVERLDRIESTQPELWDTKRVAQFFNRSPDRTRREILIQPTFPKAVRIEADGRKAHPQWWSNEVRAWAKKH
jgi:hypothetical protein